MTPPSMRQLFEQSILPKALVAPVNADLVKQAQDIQKRFDIGDEDFRKIFKSDPDQVVSGTRMPFTRKSEPSRLALTQYGQKLFERAGEIGKIRAESAKIKSQPYGRVRARRTGLARG